MGANRESVGSLIWDAAMSKAPSDDLRERVVEAVSAGMSRRQAAARFQVGASSAMEMVLFRRRDLEQLAHRLTDKGHIVTPINWDAGSGPLDRYIDVAPYKAEPHLKLALNGFAAKLIGFIVQRDPA